MSCPSREGRPSIDSEPSVTSSHTLNSRYSGGYENHGEGSSSPRQSSTGPRTNSAFRNDGYEERPKSSGSPLAEEYIAEQDFARRRHRTRNSGGFLLDSAFPPGPRTRQQPYEGTHSDGSKGKNSVRHTLDQNDSGHQGRIRSGNNPSLGSSPLSRGVVTAAEGVAEHGARVDSGVSEGRDEGNIPVSKTRQPAQQRPDADGSRERDPDDGVSRPAIDPNQIVRMALNLSESRRRNMSASQLVTSPLPGTRKSSAALPQDGNFHSYGTGSSLRQYLDEQRRVSSNRSPAGGKASLSNSRHMSTSMQRSGSMAIHGASKSPATAARCEKARAYIELRMEYLRLLEYLPPLKPDASAPGNFIVSTNNVPGSPHAELTRVPSYAGSKHQLGRPYNPLQYIRNQGTRARERRAFDHPPEEFLDIEKVRDWVDRVEIEAKHPDYRQNDQVSLPMFHEEHEVVTGPSKPARPRTGWITTPEELLADAYWLEQGDNKTLIEDRHGRKIFPHKEPPKQQDFLLPRGSKEYPEKRRKSWVEGIRLSGEHTADESDPGSERGRKRRLLPAFRAESPKRGKQGWKSSRTRSNSPSDSSNSEAGSQKQRSKKKKTKRKPGLFIDVNNNTGPLQLRMKEMMENEAKETRRQSDLLTPDTPYKWGGRPPDNPDNRTSSDSKRLPNDSASVDAQMDLKVPPRNRQADLVHTLDANEPRSSFEDLDSTEPNTPLHPSAFPHIGSDLSPPSSRGASVSRKPKKSRLDIFRVDEGTKSHKHDTDSKRNSRNVSEEIGEGAGLGNAILAAPGAVKHLLAHRKNDSVSSLNSPEGVQRRDSKEPARAVTRFFKGVKNEGSKVGEFIFRRDRPPEDTDSDLDTNEHSAYHSDTDEEGGKIDRKPRPKVARSSTATTTASVASKKTGRYNFELPTFRSSNQTEEDKADSADSDHIRRQALASANSRSPRFDRLAPPRMDLRELSATSSPAPSPLQSPSSGRERLNETLLQPGGIGRGGFSNTSLANLSSRQRSSSRPTPEGKRHWSITDDNSNSLHRKASATVITQSDIARIRALFLCSGIKAREIARRAGEQRMGGPPPFLIRAAEAANARLIPIPKKEEHVLAARILTQNLEASNMALHASADEFRESAVKDMMSLLNTLKSRVELDVLPRVRNSSDEAVRTISDVSGNAPLAVKQVNDEIDKMIRHRRRRMRWVRRVGWMLVEWTLIGGMWWVWLIVVILGTLKKVFVFGWRIIRWMLWI